MPHLLSSSSVSTEQGDAYGYSTALSFEEFISLLCFRTGIRAPPWYRSVHSCQPTRSPSEHHVRRQAYTNHDVDAIATEQDVDERDHDDNVSDGSGGFAIGVWAGENDINRR